MTVRGAAACLLLWVHFSPSPAAALCTVEEFPDHYEAVCRSGAEGTVEGSGGDVHPGGTASDEENALQREPRHDQAQTEAGAGAVSSSTRMYWQQWSRSRHGQR